MAKAQHIHRLKRLRYKSGNVIFFCSLPDCSFKTNVQLALGKRSLCWRCGNDFIMSEYSLRLAKPHCEACHKPKGPEWDKNTADLSHIKSDIRETFHLPPNRELKQGEIPETLSLTERLNKLMHKQPEQKEEEL